VNQEQTLREEHRAATRAALLEAATELFSTRGFAATSIDEIARRARVTKGALYYHFRTKNDVFAAVYSNMAIELSDSVRRASAGADAVARIRAAADGFFASAEDERIRRVMFVEGPSILGGTRCREIDREHFLGLVTELLEQVQEHGFLTGLDADVLSRLTLALLIEASQMLGSSEDRSATRAQLEAVALAMMRGFANP
jgi:AcrR family transcriptional regulator